MEPVSTLRLCVQGKSRTHHWLLLPENAPASGQALLRLPPESLRDADITGPIPVAGKWLGD
jgi:hypothetical protein